MSLRNYPGNLLDKLYNRQVFGEFVRGIPLSNEPSRQLFKKVPNRLVFSLCDTIPNLGNHILMGPSRCGQILLTYTYSMDSSSDFSPSMHYRYRLHFWMFRPNWPAAKIGEVQLFDGAFVTEMLNIGIAQWPNENQRLLVYGTCQGPDVMDWGAEMEHKSSTYVTITTLPCLTGCENCRAVAASFDEEEMAAGWESGVGLSCMRHGLTVHTHFTAPHIYTLDPEICLATNNRVVFNTGAFLHSLSVNVEEASRPPSPAPPPPSAIVVEPIINRLSYNFLQERMYNIFVSDDWSCNMIQLLFGKLSETGSHLETNQLPFFLQLALQMHFQKYNTAKCKTVKKGSARGCCDWAVTLLNSEASRPKQRWFSSSSRLQGVNIFQKAKGTRRSLDNNADNVYDFMESEDLCCEPKFKLYRRRCLADKMYEFRSDEELVVGSENIRPLEVANNGKNEIFKNIASIITAKKREELPISQSLPSHPLVQKNEVVSFEPNPTVKAIIADWDLGGVEVESEAEKREKVITKFLAGITGKTTDVSKNYKARRSLGRWSPLKPLNNKGQIQTRSMRLQQQPFKLTDEMRKEMDRGFGHQTVIGCTTKFTRRYIEVDQEITSTITDIEDDVSGTGFHCVLPITAHGSSYSQMEMIANAKAMKLGILCAVVRQESLDIEQLCYKAAQFICKMEGFRFWFCSDYDTEIVRVCHLTGDVLGVLFIRMNAEDIREPPAEDKVTSMERVDMRNFYETRCLYIWKPSKCQVFLEGFRGLKKVPMVATRPWCPAGKEAKTLRCTGSCTVLDPPLPRAMFHKVPSVEGAPVISVDTIIDHDNLIGFCRQPNSSSLDFA